MLKINGRIIFLLILFSFLLIAIPLVATWVEDRDIDAASDCPSEIWVEAKVKGNDVGNYFADGSVSHSFDCGSASGCDLTCEYHNPIFYEWVDGGGHVVKAATEMSGTVYGGVVPIEDICAYAEIKA